MSVLRPFPGGIPAHSKGVSELSQTAGGMRERAFQRRENVIYYTLSLFSRGGTGRHSRCFLSWGKCPVFRCQPQHTQEDDHDRITYPSGRIPAAGDHLGAGGGAGTSHACGGCLCTADTHGGAGALRQLIRISFPVCPSHDLFAAGGRPGTGGLGTHRGTGEGGDDLLRTSVCPPSFPQKRA